MSEEPRIAVFIDYENLALGVRDENGKRGNVEVGLVLKRLLEKGRIVYKRAYCDWSHYRGATRDLHNLGVVMVDIPQTRVGGKNSADIHMVVDAMDLCWSKDHISTFALLSGDSDFSPLVQKLKENDKRVIGCGVKNSTSGLLVAACDEFIYYDDLVRRRAAASPRKSKPKDTGGPTSAESRKDEAIDQLMDIVRSLDEDYENVWSSMVKQTIGRVHPGFNHKFYGYPSFYALLKDAETRGLIGVQKDAARGNHRVFLKDG